MRVAWHGILAREWWAHSRIKINGGRFGFGIVVVSSPQATMPCLQSPVWMSRMPRFGLVITPHTEFERGIRVLGTPLCSHAFVRAQLQAIGETHELLLNRILAIQDLQSAWLLFLFCAATRATLYLRVCHPKHSIQFAHQHNVNVWQRFCSLLGKTLHSTVWEVSSLPFHLGGLGLRSASRTIHAACWGSWADCLNTIRQRHAQTMVQALDSHPETAIHLVGATWGRATLASEGFESPSWHQLLQGLRPQQLAFDEMEPGFSSHGCRTVFPFSNRVAAVHSHSASTLPFSIGSHVRASFFRRPFLFYCPLPLNFSGCFSFADSGFLFHLLRVLAGWPSTRRPWPSPCSVCEGRCSRRSWFLRGERSCSGLP